MQMVYGYARDRTALGLARQVDDLVAAGIPPERVFRDVGGTGSNEPRPGLDALLAALHPSDEVVTGDPSRLAGGVAELDGLVAALERVGAIARTLDAEPT